MIDAGADGVQIETCQDLLQARAAIIGAHRAATARKVDLPILVDFTVETTGTMLMGSETGAALTVLESLGVDAIGLNCATGPCPRLRGRGPVIPSVLTISPPFWTTTLIVTACRSSVAAAVPPLTTSVPLPSGFQVDRFPSARFTTPTPLPPCTTTSR